MTVSAEGFLDVARDAVARVEKTQMDAIREASTVLAGRMRSGGVVQLFGTGHSRAFSMEMAGRAGGLVPTHAMYLEDLALFGRYPAREVKDPTFERRPEVVHELIDLYDVRPEDAFVVTSNSGRNASIVEMALVAKERGFPLVAVTSMAHTSSVSSRHPSGRRLYELADIVIDNCAPHGDAALELGGGRTVCAVSSVTGAVIAQALTAEIARCYQEVGEEPPVLVSANLDGADEVNAALRAPYRGRIAWEV
ncbi:MAG: sugar isomerase domain-containing protein [Acidimicrobiales bacterium]